LSAAALLPESFGYRVRAGTQQLSRSGHKALEYRTHGNNYSLEGSSIDVKE
jgi:hypothetical protein